MRLARSLRGIASVTLPLAEIDAIAAYLRLTGEGGNWDWVWTESAPPANDAESPVVELQPAHPAVLTPAGGSAPAPIRRIL